MFAPVLERVTTKYPNDVVAYIKHFPLSGHADSGPAAKAAMAAYRQGKFWEFHALLFRDQTKQSRQDLFGHAKSLGLDMARFEADFNDPAIDGMITNDKKEGIQAGIAGTPAVYVNGREVPELSVGELVDWIEEELALNP